MHQGGRNVAMVAGNLSTTRHRWKREQSVRKVYLPIRCYQQVGKPRAPFSRDPQLRMVVPVLRRDTQPLSNSNVLTSRTTALLRSRIFLRRNVNLRDEVHGRRNLFLPFLFA